MIVYIYGGSNHVFRGTRKKGKMATAGSKERVKEMYNSIACDAWVSLAEATQSKRYINSTHFITREQFWAFVNRGEKLWE